jgi:hypothetical protein
MACRFALLLLSIACSAACGARSELLEPRAPSDAGTRDVPVAPGDAGGCGPLSSTPTELATFGSASVVGGLGLDPVQLVVAGGSVYVEVLDTSGSPHSIERVPLGGGASTTMLTGMTGCNTSPFNVGPLVSDGTHLYTVDTESTGCSGYPRHVTALDLADGSVATLPDPLDGPDVRVLGIVASSDRVGALWLSQDQYVAMPSANLVRWDGTSASVVGTVPGLGVDFVAAGDAGFEETYQDLFSIPLASQPLAASRIGATSIDTFRFVAANHHAVFFARGGDTIVRRDAATGMESVVVTSGAMTRARFARPGWADDEWLYYFAGTTTPSLVRVPEHGGASETVWSDPHRQLVAVTSDECSIYWLAGRSFSPTEQAPALMGRRR